MPLDGRQLGYYRLLHMLGRGGMGEVYLADDIHIPRQVTVKVINRNRSQSAQDAQPLSQEALRAILALDHPHIIPILDYGSEQLGADSISYLVMPYRPEGSLLDWHHKRQEQTPLTYREVSHVLLQVADALQYAHERGITHQHIKPSNILLRHRSNVTDLPDVMLTDFHIAGLSPTPSPSRQNSPPWSGYTAPEQLEGQPSHASDQYALAVVAFQLLTGRFPFTEQTDQPSTQHAHMQLIPASSLNPRVSSAVDAVLLRALAKQPEARFSTVLQFAQAFLRATLEDSSFQSTSVDLAPAAQKTQISEVPTQTASTALSPRPEYAFSVTPVPSAIENITLASPYSQQAPARPMFSRIQKALLIVLLIVVVLAGGGFWLATTANSSADTAQQTRTTGSKDREATQAQQNATATAIANDPYLSGKGALLANDSLSGPKLWQGSTSGDWGGTCAFKGGTYHITQSIAQQRYYHCGEESFQANNFIYEVRITVINGNCGGITFRYNAKEHSGYRFYICSDGTARLNVYPTGSSFTSLVADTYPALRKGYNQENTIAALANGNHIDLYINKQKIASITDDTLNKGEFALFAVGFDKPTEVAFRDVKIWRL